MVEATRCAIVTASTTDPRFWLGLSDAVITVMRTDTGRQVKSSPCSKIKYHRLKLIGSGQDMAI